MKERRHDSRLPVNLPISFATYEIQGLKDGVLQDLSRQGASVSSPIPVQVGTETACYIHTESDPTPIIIDLAKVRWVGPGTFGLEFVLISRAKEKDRLNRLLVALARASRNL